MDKQTDPKKISTPTPRRTLGLRRTATPKPCTPPNYSPDELHTVPRAIDAIASSSSSLSSLSQTKNEDDSLVTPTKRTKLATGRLVFGQKQTNDAVNIMENTDCEIAKPVEELKADISKLNAHLQAYEKYMVDKKNLKRLIETWSNAGTAALKMLQMEIKPEQDIHMILTHFNLPIDIFEFVVKDE